MAELDVNQEAFRQVQEVTDSDSKPEIDELLASPELRKQLREAEARLSKEPQQPDK
jgi:hypothetical protein